MGLFTSSKTTKGKSYPQRPNPRIPSQNSKGGSFGGRGKTVTGSKLSGGKKKN